MKNKTLKLKKIIYNQFVIYGALAFSLAAGEIISGKAYAQSKQSSPQKTKPLLTINNTEIDHNFINREEGKALKGYVPLANRSSSGVTIGYGFDVGQMHLAEFNRLPISQELKIKLQPYVGLKQHQAKAFLQRYPLTINHNELNELNQIAKNKILQPLAKFYERASGKSFATLPPQAQTALFSFAYQHGPGFMRKTSALPLWEAYVTQEWSQASKILRNHKMYAPRRIREAKLLEQLA